MNQPTNKIKVLFLDIDGVLNVIPESHDQYGAVFNPYFVSNLAKIVHQTGCLIVMSSSWRKSGLTVMQQMWMERELPGKLIDTTPSIYTFKTANGIQFWNNKLNAKQTPKIKGYSIPRGCEIDYWLQYEAGQFGEVQSYCILDDDSDMLLHQKKHFVHCANNFDHPFNQEGYGLTEVLANQCIRILNNIKS